jgi:hypothetical protein
VSKICCHYVKMVIVLCEGQTLTRQHRGEKEVWLQPTDKPAVGSWWSAPRSGCFSSRERHGTHCTGCWVSLRAGLGEKKYRPHRDTIPVASRYTDYANPTVGVLRLYNISTVSFTSPNGCHAMNFTAIRQSHTCGHNTIYVGLCISASIRDTSITLRKLNRLLYIDLYLLILFINIYLHNIFIFLIHNSYMFRPIIMAIFIELQVCSTCAAHMVVAQTCNFLKMARIYGRNL